MPSSSNSEVLAYIVSKKSLFVHTECCIEDCLYDISPFSRISHSAIDIKSFPVTFGLLVHFISLSMRTRYQVFFCSFSCLLRISQTIRFWGC